VTLLRLIKWKGLPYSVFAGLIIVGYQWALDHLPFGEYDTLTVYIALSRRNDLFRQNREGIFSFLGIRLLDLTNERISLDISCWHGCREFDTPSETTIITVHSIFADVIIYFTHSLFHSVNRSVPIDDSILWTNRESSICNFPHDVTDKGKSPICSMDSST